MTIAEDVLAVVRLVPPGCVVAYGDLAELFGTSPRIIGRIMATNEVPGLPWWRIVRADGGMADHLVDVAEPHWREEAMAVVDGRVRIRRHRADLAALADAAEALLGPLPGAGEAPLSPLSGAGEASLGPLSGAGEASLGPLSGAGEGSLGPLSGAGEASPGSST